MARDKETGLKYRDRENPPRYWDADRMDVTADQFHRIWKKPSKRIRERIKSSRDVGQRYTIYFLKNGETWVELYTWAGPFGAPWSYQLPEIACARAAKLKKALDEL